MNQNRILDITKRFGDYHIGVVGDLIYDCYIWGSATRISPEAPVPIVKVNRKTSTLGGAANVLRNIGTLGSHAVAFGVIGNDQDGESIINLCEQWKINSTGIIKDPLRRTTVKTRLIADTQQVARIDDEQDNAIDPDTEKKLMTAIADFVQQNRLDALIVEDYNKGVITQSLIKCIHELTRKHKIPVALDPHPANHFDMSKITLMTPNRSEAFAMAGEIYKPTVFPVTDDSALRTVGCKLLNRWSPEVLMITLGKAGMAIFHGDNELDHIPTAAKEVFDVSGAGDTVIATFMLSILAGATSLEAAEIANHAAGYVVGQVGTVSVTVDELVDSFGNEQNLKS